MGNFGFGKSIVFVVVFLLWSSLIPISFFCCSVSDAKCRSFSRCTYSESRAGDYGFSPSRDSNVLLCYPRNNSCHFLCRLQTSAEKILFFFHSGDTKSFVVTVGFSHRTANGVKMVASRLRTATSAAKQLLWTRKGN